MKYSGNEAKAQYIKRMEHIIAKHCKTKNLNVGEYRYPVTYSKNGKLYKTSGKGMANVTMTEIPSMHYEFGAHRVNIGKALIEILDFIEQNIDDVVCPFDYYNDGVEEE